MRDLNFCVVRLVWYKGLSLKIMKKLMKVYLKKAVNYKSLNQHHRDKNCREVK